MTRHRIWIWFADNGNIRKWDRQPFDEGTEYVLAPAEDQQELVEQMVRRFLTWKLPEDFAPDGGIQFIRQTDYGHVFGPVGTNLLDYTQAKAMVLHMLDGLPSHAPVANAAPADGALVAFAKEVIRAAWGGHEGGDLIQETAIKHGLLEEVVFDPAIYNDPLGYAGKGDSWHQFAGPLSAAPAQPVANAVVEAETGEICPVCGDRIKRDDTCAVIGGSSHSECLAPTPPDTDAVQAGAMALPAIPDDDADFTPDLARKIIAKYQQMLAAAPAAPSSGAGWRPIWDAPEDRPILLDIGETLPDLVDARVGQFVSELRGRELGEVLSASGGWIIFNTDSDWFVIPFDDAYGWLPLPPAPLASPEKGGA